MNSKIIKRNPQRQNKSELSGKVGPFIEKRQWFRVDHGKNQTMQPQMILRKTIDMLIEIGY